MLYILIEFLPVALARRIQSDDRAARALAGLTANHAGARCVREGCDDCGVSARAGGEPQTIGEIVGRLPIEELRTVLLSAVDRHLDVERHVRLAAARASGDLAGLRGEVDRGLRTRRFLSYRESSEWARAAQPIVDELRLVVERAPSRDLVVLLERAVGHVVKVILRADDSNGTIGDLARELLDLHAQTCDAGVADPVKLAAWMVRFSCQDQDFFGIDPVRYATALGEPGLAAYRQAIAGRDGERSFAVRWARERLAVLDEDTQAIITLLGQDLSSPYQFIRVCEAMAELGRDEDVLSWARRGITETQGWQVARLYDLACEVHERRSAGAEILALRREQHVRMASASTYRALRRAADALHAWELGRDAARKHCVNATAASSSTRCCRTAMLTARGRPPPRTQRGIRAPRAAPGWPKRASQRDPTRRSPGTYGSPTKSSCTPDARHTHAPSPCSNARAAPRKQPARATPSQPPWPIFASATGRRPTLIAMLDKAALA
jgi:hypothetical protein